MLRRGDAVQWVRHRLFVSWAPWGLMGLPGFYGLGPCGSSWALAGQALAGPLGPLWASPLWPPWALMGRALGGPPVLLWARPLWVPWALVGWTLVGLLGPLWPGPLRPHPPALMGWAFMDTLGHHGLGPDGHLSQSKGKFYGEPAEAVGHP